MAGACRMFCQNLNTPLSKMISTKLRTSPMGFLRYYSHGEHHDQTAIKQSAFAEFFEKTKENKNVIEEDVDFEVLLRNSNFINVTCNTII